MEMTPVSSSDIASVGYDYDSATLRVTFLKSGTYDYYSVPSEIYDGLMSASSKGKYLNLYVKKGGYAYAKV